MSAVAIIPARGASVRVARKNILNFMGKPIIAYSIEAARASELFERIVVSTDDNEIADVAHEYGASILRRAPDDGVIGTQEVTRNALLELPTFDYACCVYATAPLMTANDLRHGFEMLRAQPDRPFAYPVDLEGNDAGQWYWGRVADFLARTPLHRSVRVLTPEARVCDINTESDWQRAERMYEALHGK